MSNQTFNLVELTSGDTQEKRAWELSDLVGQLAKPEIRNALIGGGIGALGGGAAGFISGDRDTAMRNAIMGAIAGGTAGAGGGYALTNSQGNLGYRHLIDKLLSKTQQGSNQLANVFGGTPAKPERKGIGAGTAALGLGALTAGGLAAYGPTRRAGIEKARQLSSRAGDFGRNVVDRARNVLSPTSGVK